jgi:hypothetical protein
VQWKKQGIQNTNINTTNLRPKNSQIKMKFFKIISLSVGVAEDERKFQKH